MAKVGFIGLGNMGGPMARNLIKAGHQLQVFDLDPEKVVLATEFGAFGTETIAAAVDGVETVVSMLPEGRHVREVYLGDGGVLSTAAPGKLLIDASTIDVATAQAVHEAARQAGFEMVDAPVSGGTGGAKGASLTFMCGGAAATVDRARSLLADMGRNIVRAGGPGLGQAAKICNNMLAGIASVAVAEAFVLGERLGLEHQALFDIISTSSGQNWFMMHNCPVPGPVPEATVHRDFAPGFMAALMAKDLRLAQAAAQDTGTSTPVGAQVSALFDGFCDAGYGEKDVAAIIKLVRGEVDVVG